MDEEKKQQPWPFNEGLSTQHRGYKRDAKLGNTYVEKPSDCTTTQVESVSRSEGNQVTEGIPHAYTFKKHASCAAYEVSFVWPFRIFLWRILLVARTSLFPDEEEHENIIGCFEVNGHHW